MLTRRSRKKQLQRLKFLIIIIIILVITRNRTSSVMIFSQFESDLRNFKNLIDSTSDDVKQLVSSKFHYNPIYFKNISMFTKFFLNKDLFREIYLTNIKLNNSNNTSNNKNNNNPNSTNNKNNQKTILAKNIQDSYLNNEIKKSEEKDWDRIIIRNTKNNLFVFEKASARFAQDLGYKNNELIGMELNSFIPFNFVDSITITFWIF